MTNNSSPDLNQSSLERKKVSGTKNAIAITVGVFLMILVPAKATAVAMSILRIDWRRKIAKCTDPDFLYRSTRIKVKNSLENVRINEAS
jgi:hypothetical protein